MSIKNRLLAVILLVVLLPSLVFMGVLAASGFSHGRKQVVEKLESVAILKEAEINNWSGNLRSNLATVLAGKDALGYARTLLSGQGDASEQELAYERLLSLFSQVVGNDDRFDELFLMDLKRQIVLSTDRAKVGQRGSVESNVYFPNALRGDYLLPPSYTLSVGDIAIMVARPVLDEMGAPVGILVGRTGPSELGRIMLERTGLGDTGETYLVSRNFILLSEPLSPQPHWGDAYYVFSEGAYEAVWERHNGSADYDNYAGMHVIGVYRWLPELQVALLAEQSEAEAMAPTITAMRINMLVTFVAALFASAVSIVFSRSITRPLSELVETTTRFAGGDLEVLAPAARQDEIGVLAQAFNLMAIRLRELVTGLEQQVRERTLSLKQQAVQLEACIRVSREITSILDMEELLTRVAQLILDAFHHYHVAVYLLDGDAGVLRLAAGAGQAWPSLQGLGRELPLGVGSLNGESAQDNRVLVVNDVTRDPRYRPEVGLPNTLSEMVAPLRIGKRVLGTLDVQADTLDAFGSMDAEVHQSLADQVAIAIENARLYEDSRMLATLEERNRLARELHDSVTQSLYSMLLFAGRGRRAFENGDSALNIEHFAQLEQAAQQALKEMRLSLYELRPAELERVGLVKALKQRLHSVEERVGVSTKVVCQTDIVLPGAVEEALYHVAQEALNNALKHGFAEAVAVEICKQDGRVSLKVIDDGVGFVLDDVLNGGGLGLASMRHRIEGIGGSVVLDTIPGYGTIVHAEVPL